MKTFTDTALETARFYGATYADIRIVHRKTQQIEVRNGAVSGLTQTETHGFGVRVVADGAWGFAASSVLTREEVERVAAEAVRIARASATALREPVDLGPPEVHVDTYRTPYRIDPFSVPLEEKIGLLLAADEAMRRVPGIRVSRGSITCWRENKAFASTEGS